MGEWRRESGDVGVKAVKTENRYNASRHREQAFDARPGEKGSRADDNNEKPEPKLMRRPTFATAVVKNHASENCDECNERARIGAEERLLKGRKQVGGAFNQQNFASFAGGIGEKSQKGNSYSEDLNDSIKGCVFYGGSPRLRYFSFSTYII